LGKKMTNTSHYEDSADRVVVVPAASALKEYRDHSVYMCLPHRFFRDCARMAFYTNNRIYHRITKIVGKIEAISPDEIESMPDISESERAKLRTLLNNLKADRIADWRNTGFEIFFLTPDFSSETLVLPRDIENDRTSKAGRRTAFARNQRYVSLASLEKGPKYTSELRLG
jgi:hypothetical protein